MKLMPVGMGSGCMAVSCSRDSQWTGTFVTPNEIRCRSKFRSKQDPVLGQPHSAAGRLCPGPNKWVVNPDSSDPKQKKN